jgi:hypothetical protein
MFLVLMAMRHHRVNWGFKRPSAETTEPVLASEPIEVSTDNSPLVFGPVNELDLPGDTNQFLDLGDMTAVLAGNWLKESGADLLYAGDEKIILFDGVSSVLPGNDSTNLEDWDSTTPEKVRTAMDRLGSPPGGRAVNVLTRDQSATWFFKTREGGEGILQLVRFTNDPPSAKIRYKLIQQTNGNGTPVPLEVDKSTRDTLADRLEAASMMTDMNAMNRVLGSLALDAAKAGNAGVASASLEKMTDLSERDRVALETVRALAKHGLRKPALDIAKSITDFTRQNQALSELAK